MNVSDLNRCEDTLVKIKSEHIDYQIDIVKSKDIGARLNKCKEELKKLLKQQGDLTDVSVYVAVAVYKKS